MIEMATVLAWLMRQYSRGLIKQNSIVILNDNDIS